MRLQTLLMATLLLCACGDDDEGPAPSPMDGGVTVDASSPMDSSVDAAVPEDCYTNPKTYLELINACTDAEKIEKKPALPLLKSDGTLPPLP